MSKPERGAREALWSPPADVRERSEVGRFLQRLELQRGLTFESYADLWEWSVSDLSAFWSSVREHFGTWPDGDADVLVDARMPGARWYPEARLNYAERALQLSGRADDDVVVVGPSQTRATRYLTVRDLRDEVARARAGLRRAGVGRGDRVAAYAPNIPECLVGFLATASLGATWSSCPPEFGTGSVIDRFGQFAPSVLIATDGYRYGAKSISRLAEIDRIRQALPTVRTTVLIPYLEPSPGTLPDTLDWDEMMKQPEPLAFEPVSFDHPLYVLYTSGTTGLPKPIVHGHGGILLEHCKALGLHTDLGPGDRFMWHTTTGWMMWNYLVSGLLTGASVVLFDGDPSFPDLAELWRLAERERVTYLGVGVPYLMRCRMADLRPGDTFDLSALRGVGATGSPLPEAGDYWVSSAVGQDVHLGSLSGGTDVCTGFLGPSPLVPVWPGEISCRMLGARIEAFDVHGRSLVGTEGELVITAPMPSMPVGFLNDEDGSRYREAYFSAYPGAWRHGDWLTITERGTCVISGRSDATLNRGGVRIGTGEIYAVVEDFEEVADSLVVHLEDPDGGDGSIIMLVAPRPGVALDDGLRGRVATAIRERLSPRHVPDVIVPVRTLPRTMSGKRLEVPVKRMLGGAPMGEVVSADTITDHAALDDILETARREGVIS